MEVKIILTRDEVTSAPLPNGVQKFDISDAYACDNCPYQVEILKINERENTITFNCLNPKEKGKVKTIQINKYLDSMKKYTYLYSKCSLCNKNQNELKDKIFSYCIKCETIICFDCIGKHLKINEINHHGLNKECIIKSNEKNIKCLLHPKEKNLAFCLKCNKHICKECMRSKKHMNHTKINIIEVLATEEIKNILNDIINIYRERIKQLNKGKEKTEAEILKVKKDDKKIQEQRKKNKMEEIQKELKKELEENEKLLNDNLFKLKIKYENDIKLCKRKFKISNENINKKYERLNIYYNKKLNEDFAKLEKKIEISLLILNITK